LRTPDALTFQVPGNVVKYRFHWPQFLTPIYGVQESTQFYAGGYVRVSSRLPAGTRRKPPRLPF